MQTVNEAVEIATEINLEYDLQLDIVIDITDTSNCIAYAEGDTYNIECLFAEAINRI